MIDHQDMQGKQQGAQKYVEIPHVHGEPFRNTQEIKAHKGDAHCRPDLPSHLLVQEDPQHRHDHNIKGSDKPGFPGRGIHKPDLLQAAGGKKKNAAADAADDQILSASRRISPVPSAQESDTGQKSCPADQVAHSVKGKGPQIIHPHALGHKGRSPDKCCQDQHARIFRLHSRTSSSVSRARTASRPRSGSIIA